MPEDGWDDHMISSFLNEIASMDSNNFVGTTTATSHVSLSPSLTYFTQKMSVLVKEKAVFSVVWCGVVTSIWLTA